VDHIAAHFDLASPRYVEKSAREIDLDDSGAFWLGENEKNGVLAFDCSLFVCCLFVVCLFVCLFFFVVFSLELSLLLTCRVLGRSGGLECQRFRIPSLPAFFESRRYVFFFV
jgi:hypothetical protein